MNSSQIIILSVITFLLFGIVFSCNGKQNINEDFQETQENSQRISQLIYNLRQQKCDSMRRQGENVDCSNVHLNNNEERYVKDYVKRTRQNGDQTNSQNNLTQQEKRQKLINNLERTERQSQRRFSNAMDQQVVFGGDYLNGSDNNWSRAGYSGNQNISPTSYSTPSIVYNDQQKCKPSNGIKIVNSKVELDNNVEIYPHMYKDKHTKIFYYYDQKSKIMTEIEYPITKPDMTVSEAETILKKHKFSKNQINKVKNMLKEDICAETETAKQLRNALGQNYSICESNKQSSKKKIKSLWYSAIGINTNLHKYKTTISVLTILILIVVIIIIYMLYIRNSGNNNSNYPSFNNSNRTNVVKNNLKFLSKFNTK